MAAPAIILNNTGNAQLPANVQTMRAAIKQLINATSTLNLIYAQHGGMIDTSGATPNYAQIEAAYGLQAGQGAALYALEQGANALLTNQAFLNFISQIV